MGHPKLVEMGWDGKQYEIRACYATADVSVKESGTVAGVDLGEIHLKSCYFKVLKTNMTRK
ncbi:MAG: hypothetical protein Kow0049_24260 [Stanieria sp.]